MIDFTKAIFKRIIVHKVSAKLSDTLPSHADLEDDLLEFGESEENLKKKLTESLNKEIRTFKLEIAQIQDGSFYSLAKEIKKQADKDFIETSKSIAQLLERSHYRRTIPSGLLLILDGYTENKQHFLVVIKAELQEVFKITDGTKTKKMELLKDVFLSPAKDFYKISLFIEKEHETGFMPNDIYDVFMYDDQFNSTKDDLTEYFYDRFLGFTTSKNDKLLTKNFHDDFMGFADTHVKNKKNNSDLKSTVRLMLTNENNKFIVPNEFCITFLPEELRERFAREVAFKYPNSFSRNTSTITSALEKAKINLSFDLKLSGPASSIESVDVYEGAEIRTPDFMQMVFNGGNEPEQVVVIRSK